MTEDTLKNVWIEIGKPIARGEDGLEVSDLLSIYSRMDLKNFNPSYLPTGETVIGGAEKRKDAIFSLAQKIWGLTPEDWLKMEKDLLDESRKISGSTVTTGKDDITDVVSAEILIRIIAAARLVAENTDDYRVVDEAVIGVNLVLAEACAKGRGRMERKSGRSVYAILRENGLMVGLGGGKFLPYPEKLLPILLSEFLSKDRVNKEAYLNN
jgi:hypothetical protein